MTKTHTLSAGRIVLFTRFSTGGLTLTDAAGRNALARQIRAARRFMQEGWALHGYKGPYRIFGG